MVYIQAIKIDLYPPPHLQKVRFTGFFVILRRLRGVAEWVGVLGLVAVLLT